MDQLKVKVDSNWKNTDKKIIKAQDIVNLTKNDLEIKHELVNRILNAIEKWEPNEIDLQLIMVSIIEKYPQFPDLLKNVIKSTDYNLENTKLVKTGPKTNNFLRDIWEKFTEMFKKNHFEKTKEYKELEEKILSLQTLKATISAIIYSGYIYSNDISKEKLDEILNSLKKYWMEEWVIPNIYANKEDSWKTRITISKSDNNYKQVHFKNLDLEVIIKFLNNKIKLAGQELKELKKKLIKSEKSKAE